MYVHVVNFHAVTANQTGLAKKFLWPVINSSACVQLQILVKQVESAQGWKSRLAL